MVEKWFQLTCDGCGETEFATMPNMKMREVLHEFKQYKWIHKGSLDYCGRCVLDGTAKQNSSIFREKP